ncbi:MAG: DUF1080 domain-containing protein, partial [Gemmatimonadales bacterium]
DTIQGCERSLSRFFSKRTSCSCLDEKYERTVHTDEWVTVDLLVLGDSLIAHVVDGDTVLMYSRPVVGGADSTELAASALEDGQPLTSGYIAIQSESHPTQFRQILIKELPRNP